MMKYIISGIIAFIIGKGVAAVYDLSHEPLHAQHAAPASYTPADVHQLDKLIEEMPIIYPTIPLVSRIARAESGGNPKARNALSTASGPLQFTNPTWRLAVSKWGKLLHIRLRDKNKLAAQRLMAQKLADDNARIIEGKIGHKPADWELYAAHVFGAHGSAKLIEANTRTPNRKAVYFYSQAVVDSNRGIFFEGNWARTVKQVCQLLNDKIG